MNLNYLTLLKPSVFRHLFKVTDVPTTNNIQEAFHMSHDHQRCQNGKHNQVCEDFKQTAVDEVVGECVEFTTHVTQDVDGFMVAFFPEEDQKVMESFKGHIKHLHIMTTQYLLKNSAYTFLVQHFIEDNESLESFEVYLQDELEYREYRNPITRTLFSQRPSWPMFMAKMKKQKKLTATLVVNFIADGAKSLAECCELYDLPKADTLFQYLVEVILKDFFPGDKILSEMKSAFTENPSRFFVEKLPVLQILQISAYNLGDSLLDLLAMRAQNRKAPPLKMLNITANQSLETSRFHGQLPTLRNSSWTGLVKACPNLEVNLRITLGNYSERFRSFEKKRIAEKVAMVREQHNTAVDVPIQNGHGSPKSILTVHNDRYDEGGIATCHFTDPPSTAGATMLSLLKKSVPLVYLHLERIEADDLIDVILHKCGQFSKTLKVIKVRELIGDVHEVYFKKLTSSPFSMKQVMKEDPDEIDIF